MPTPKQSASAAVDEQLARYRSMRNFGLTAEPSGGHAPPPQALPFCIQKHAASHLHYDFRLAWNGVLKSWACAKGPSLSVTDRRLAIQVEDHPIEYGGFEGIIPKGQYGGGTVMLWDHGTWEPQPESRDVDAALRDGHLKLLLHGTKLHGKWALIRMTPKPQETKPNWLLMKEHDEYERPPGSSAITIEAPNSVITGRSLDQIAANEDHIWQSGPPENPTVKVAEQAPTQRPSEFQQTLQSLPIESQPAFLPPQLAQETVSPPEGPNWIHELKLDGYRIQARKSGPSVELLTRSGLDWTQRMPTIAAEVAKLGVQNITLDGEIVVLAPDGTTSFADLQAAFHDHAQHSLTYFCFDLLHLEGRNPRNLPLIERKHLLTELLRSADPDHLQLSEHLAAHGLAMFHKACELHAEGIVSKRADAPYSGTRSGSWLKSKCLHEQEFVIVGYTLPGKGGSGGPGIGVLLLAYFDDQGQNLIYAGRTGTGFNHSTSAELRKRLERLGITVSAIHKPPADARRGAIWVQPILVAQVRFANWTADLQLRQAAFLGLREDKRASEVRRETAAPTPKSPRSARQNPPESIAHPAPIRLTHPSKVLDPESGLTKQQLADFYWAVAPRMLPHIAGRPLSLVRCPEGSQKPCFFQKHVNHLLPPGIESVNVPDKKSGIPEPYITLSTTEALASLAQIGVLEVHPWGSSNQALETPDRIMIDLDPDEALPWSALTTAALDVRARLKSLHLDSWVKSTGGKGLHIVIPIAPHHEWPVIKRWAHNFVLRMERENPTHYLTRMTKAARPGKIYLDYLRNERGATAIAPYSPRARKGIPVSMPLDWSELNSPTRPNFSIANCSDWSPRLTSDPWELLLKSTQTLQIDPED